MKTSIIIPTKNEPYVKTLVKQIRYIVKYDKEIIVVDKSDDEIKIEGARVIKQNSEGLGKAFLEGLKYSKGDLIILMDGDGQHDPKDLNKLIEVGKRNDIVIASRYVEGSRNEVGYIRRLISKIGVVEAKKILGLKINDAVSGYAVMKRSLLERLKVDTMGFKIITEILYRVKDKKLRIVEIPTTHRNRIAGKSKFGLKEIIRYNLLLLKLRFSA